MSGFQFCFPTVEKKPPLTRLTPLFFSSQDQPLTMCQQFVTAERWWTLQHPLCETGSSLSTRGHPIICHTSIKQGCVWQSPPPPPLAMPSNMLKTYNAVWVDWLTVARVTLTVKAKWCLYSRQYASIVKSFCIDLICCDLLGLQIDVFKCTVPCSQESCCQMGACEAVVLYKTKGCSYLVLTVLWIYPNVVDKKNAKK